MTCVVVLQLFWLSNLLIDITSTVAYQRCNIQYTLF